MGRAPARRTAEGDDAAGAAEATNTRVYEIPRPTTPRAVLHVTDPDGGTRRVVIEGGSLTIGRATDNDCVVHDGRVSRHHGRISGRRGTLVYADLGSTNGSRVNGVPGHRGRARRRRPARGGGHGAGRRGRRGARLMDNGFLLVLWAVRLLFLGLIYLFLFRVVRALLRDLRAAAREPTERPGRLVVLASPSGEPPAGQAFGLEVITALGRDVNNAIVIEDPFASADHAVLTYRGRSWYIEDLGSTNGSYVNGRRVEGVAPMGFGDELQIGQVRMRLERAAAG